MSKTWRLDDDSWGFMSPNDAHYACDGHFGLTEKQLKANCKEVVSLARENKILKEEIRLLRIYKDELLKASLPNGGE